ncbi:MAG: glyoxylate/hydroxypyruvate reductase A [Rhodobiaceae bacterium]|nr:glyoxylate/hydroxypyruvate reductase A [Rhodobiaceae bacterium]MCC0049949.1 glyoxylate/hydroxypyruvate reductase A [Rhodobiaceae bacterium]
MSLLLAVTGWDYGPWVERFRTAAPGLDIVTADGTFDPATVRYAAAWNAPEGIFANLPNVEIVFSLGAGVDHLLKRGDLPDAPVVRVVNDDLTMRMTEWVTLQVLLHHRQQRAYDAFQRAGKWEPLWQPVASRVRVGVMGLGVLGRDAVEKLASLGFDVAGWSRSQKEISGITCYSGDEGLKTFLARTDILVVLLPSTPDTSGIINAELIRGLARDGVLPERFPVLINAGRGALQVEADILATLDDGSLKGASLDVFHIEPLPSDSAFWPHPNVTVTPHVAAESDPQAIADGVVEEITRYERGEPLRYTVDRGKGY